MKFWKVFRIVTSIVFVLALAFVFLIARHRLAAADADSDLQSAPVIVR
jgi:hypothetical protein